MKKFFFLFVVFFVFNSWALDKDWVLDPKTSTLIPKYMALVKVVKGKVMVEDRELSKGAKIYANDLIQTPDNSYVVLDLIDLTTITLGPNSEFKAEKWSYRTKNDRDAVFSVLKGQWRALIRSKSKTEDQLKIKTPTVSMGVRGTELLVNVHNHGEKEITQIALLEGAIHLEGTSPEKAKDMKPGEHIIIAKNLKGLEQKDTFLNADEKKILNEFIAPGVPRLLDRVVLMNDGKLEIMATVSDKLSIKEEEENIISVKFEKAVPWKNNLKKLNNIRTENRKK